VETPVAAGLVERRFADSHALLEANIARIRIWTPEQTLARLDPALAGASRTEQPPIRFDIPPGALDIVLAAFRRVTGAEVMLSEPGLLTLHSPGVVGLHTTEDALTRLLAGTGVGSRAVAPGRFLLELRSAGEAVDVAGALPRASSAKFVEPLRDTPQTINVIPQAVIQAQGATTLRDVLRNVPGITYQAGEGGGGLPGDTLTMRGFSASGDIFMDGVRDVGAYSRDTFNLEQVEVVKGPASVFTGRGATGGSINLSTKAPHTTRSYGALISGGTENFKRGALDLNQPLGSAAGGSALRLNAMWNDADVAGRDLVHNRSWAVAPSFALGLTSRTRLSASYVHLTQDNVPDYGLPWAAFEAAPAVDQKNFYGLEGYDYEDIRNDAGTVQVTHQASSSLRLGNVTRVGRTFRDSAITAPRPPNRQLQRRTMSNGGLTNQTSVSGSARTGTLRHNWTGGLELVRESTDNRNGSQTANQPPTDLYHPDPFEDPLGPMPSNSGNPGHAVTRTAGLYLFDTAHAGPLQVSGGLRWDHSAVDYEATSAATGETSALDRTDAQVSWKAGAVYKPRTEASLYATASTSFNPAADAAASGTALSDSPTAANSVNLAPETSRHLEIGAKWDLLSARLSATAAVFRTEKTNARTRNLTNEPFVLSGRQRVDGVELSVAGSVTPRWLVLAGYAYMNSRIVATANPLEADADLALVPRQSFSLWTSVDVRAGFSVGGGLQYMDNVFRNTLNTLAVPSYGLVNATASYRVSSHLTLRVIGNNLGNAEYVDRVGGGHYIPGPRRSVAITSDLKF
jgi:catecholate siderophore receptor